LNDNPLTAVRLQLKALGYDPIPVRINKRPYKGWPNEPNDPAAIAGWARHMASVATGIRLYKSPRLFVIDLDVRIADVRDAILEAYTKRWPQFMRDCVRRHSQGVTLALIGRCDTPRGPLKSARWRRAHDDGEPDNQVEVFTQASKRFLGVDGAHSVGRAYAYHGRALWDVPPYLLPTFSADAIDAALDIADHAMQAAGLIRKQAASVGKCILYDLDAGMTIVLDDGEVLTLAELERDLKVGPPLRRTLAFPTPWDPESTTARVLATLGRDGLCLWDTKTETSHRWKWREPPESFASMARQLAMLTGVLL
jgi:hypothetical protein